MRAGRAAACSRGPWHAEGREHILEASVAQKHAPQFFVQLIATEQVLENLRGEHAPQLRLNPAPVSKMWVMLWEGHEGPDR